jgi:hypothetical protein
MTAAWHKSADLNILWKYEFHDEENKVKHTKFRKRWLRCFDQPANKNGSPAMKYKLKQNNLQRLPYSND